MIQLTRLNGTPLAVNSDLIKTAEASPDTMLTLITGEKLIVSEDCGVIIERILAYRVDLLAKAAARLGSSLDLSRIVSLASLPMSMQANVAENATTLPSSCGTHG